MQYNLEAILKELQKFDQIILSLDKKIIKEVIKKAKNIFI